MQNPANPYAPPAALVDDRAGAPLAPHLYSSITGVGRGFMVAAIVELAWAFFLGDAISRAVVSKPLEISAMVSGVDALLRLVALVFFLVFLHRVFTGMRAEFGSTKTSPGMAVGAWFIPLANFFLPPIAVAEAWRAKRCAPGFLVPIWWLAYLVFTALLIAVYLYTSRSHILQMPDRDTMQMLLWVRRVAHVVAYGAWIYIVFELTRRCTARA